MKPKRTIVVLKYKKMLLFEEIDKNVQFNSLFLGIRETLQLILVTCCIHFFLIPSLGFYSELIMAAKLCNLIMKALSY